MTEETGENIQRDLQKDRQVRTDVFLCTNLILLVNFVDQFSMFMLNLCNPSLNAASLVFW
jgi:hypothetical protein